VQHIEIVAHHQLLLAIPAFVPAIAVVGVVFWVAVRDRRTSGHTNDSDREDPSD
jgi:hypothetical protein